MAGVFFSATLGSTAQANTFVVVSHTNTEIVVELNVQVTVPVSTFVFSKQVAPTFAEQTKEWYKVSSSETVPQWRRIAHLARIAIGEDEIVDLCAQLDSIISFVGELNKAHVEGVEPMTSVTPMSMKMRKDEVTDGGIAGEIMANAPAREDHFFVVPKVVE